MLDEEAFQLIATDVLLQQLLVDLDLQPARLSHGSLGWYQMKAVCAAWRAKDNLPSVVHVPFVGDLIAFRRGGYGIVCDVENDDPKNPLMSSCIDGLPFPKKIGQSGRYINHTARDISAVVAGSPIRRLHAVQQRAKR